MLKRYNLIILAFMMTSSVMAEELLKTTESWDGGEIAYPKGQAEITSVKMRFEAGESIPFHCHPVPTLGYILEGTLEVETKDGSKTILKKGDSAVEVMKTVHRGTAIDGPVEIVVFYAGATHLPTTVFPEKDPKHEFCKG